jgi:hypothetical protein
MLCHNFQERQKAKLGPKAQVVLIKPNFKWALKNKVCDPFFLGKDPGELGLKKKVRVGVDLGANDPSSLGKGFTTRRRGLA